ncbi:hypothetical protein L1887_42430 [Cichorium endivia]|nr:hypothetical protein L1887_42430 [Cichorium endivia]
MVSVSNGVAYTQRFWEGSHLLGGPRGLLPQLATKGRGVKKWRRVHRKIGKSADTNMNHNTAVVTNETRQRSNGSVLRKTDIAREDTENSRSSTGRERHEMLPVVGGCNYESREANDENECDDDAANNEKQLGQNEAESEAEKNGGNHVDEDVMMNFHSAQEALEREVEKLKDVWKEEPSVPEEYILETQTTLNQNGLEEILKQTMEVEVPLSKANVHQLELMLQHRKLASEQVETLKKVEDAENKALQLQRQTERLKETCQEILDKEEALKLESRICRLISCFSIQTMLFLLFLYLFLLRFSSHNMELLLVPT